MEVSSGSGVLHPVDRKKKEEMSNKMREGTIGQRKGLFILEQEGGESASFVDLGCFVLVGTPAIF